MNDCDVELNDFRPALRFWRNTSEVMKIDLRRFALRNDYFMEVKK